VETSKQSDEAK